MAEHSDDKHEFGDERKRATKDLFERDLAQDLERKEREEDELLGTDYVEVSRADVAMPGQEEQVSGVEEEDSEKRVSPQAREEREAAEETAASTAAAAESREFEAAHEGEEREEQTPGVEVREEPEPPVQDEAAGEVPEEVAAEAVAPTVEATVVETEAVQAAAAAQPSEEAEEQLEPLEGEVSLGATGRITEAGGTVTYTATVDTPPASDLVITLSNGETITILAGEHSGTVDVVVEADEDAIVDATELSVHITGASGGGYDELTIESDPAVTEIVDTVDTTTVSLGATGQITEAGGTVTYTATVDNAPASDLTITLSNGETITIEAGETSGTVDVTVAADEDAIADATSMSATITGTDGGGYEQLAVDATPATTDIVDTTDTTTVSLGATGQITEAGGTVTYTATVDNAPASDLTVTLSNGETITIEAGETSGTVDITVAADEDAIADATSMSATITGTDGGGYEQ
ncbi:MAG: immunoglobulin-like domain-containing protein, partial [Sedimenticola sp.]